MLSVLFSAALLWLTVAAGSASGEAIAIYSGRFDPPTVSQLRAMRCALGAPDLPGACQELSRAISRLVILITDHAGDDPDASARERALMLGRSLSGYESRLEIVAAPAPQKQPGTDRVDRIYQIVDADGYASFRHKPASGIIEALGLYQPVETELQPLKLALFREGLKDFLADLRGACPAAVEGAECARLNGIWNRVAVLPPNEEKARQTAESTANHAIHYRRAQSEDRWAEKYVAAALHPLESTPAYVKLLPVAEDLAARTLGGLPRGKVPNLRRIRAHGDPRRVGRTLPQRHRLACAAPAGDYNADMDQYVADRFPRPFAEFLRSRLARRTLRDDALYVHDGGLDTAYDFHHRDGFTEFYFLQTRRGQLHRDIHLAVRQKPRAYRVVLTGVRGADRRANVLCQLDYTGIFSRFVSIASLRPAPLFTFNEAGRTLRLTSDDWVLFGFRGSWRRRLAALGWRQAALVRNGLDIDLFTRPETRRKLVTVRNVYGDDAGIVLESLYRKGARRVLYLGSAGAIADYAVGDAVIPDTFITRAADRIDFKENLALAYARELSGALQVHSGATQGWVQSLFEETRQVLAAWKAQSVAAVDIEGYHLARFARHRRDIGIAAVFVISDQTLGEQTIDETNAHRTLIDAAVDKIVGVLLPRVTGWNEYRPPG